MNESLNYESLFREIYENYYDRVLSYIKARVNDHTIAEDLTSDVFFRCYKNIQKFDSSKASESTWIFTITKNLLKNYYRDKKEVAYIDSMEGFDIPYEEEFDQAIRLEEIRTFLDREIAKLDSIKRQIIMMRFYDEMKTEEIAAALGMSDGNVRVIITRTLKKLRGGAEADNVIEFGF